MTVKEFFHSLISGPCLLNESKNESDSGLRYMRKFALSNRHTNIITVAPTHRYDLPEFSCVNQETQIFNRKLRKMTKDIHHVSVVDTNLTRDDFTQHGLHLNSIGKERIAKTIEQSIRTLSLTGIPAISLN